MSYLDNTGLAYLWGKIKDAFAAKSHKHAAGDITSGTLPIAQGGTGATTAANAAANIVDGQNIKPNSVSATYNISTSEGHISTNGGNINTNEGNIYASEGDVCTYYGNVYTSNGNVYARNGDVIIKNMSGTNLHKLSEKANTNHTHSASDVTSGTLPISRGGTGATTAAAARTALEVSSIGGLYYAVEATTASTRQYTHQALVYIKNQEKLYRTNKTISIGSDIPSQSDVVTLTTEISHNRTNISQTSPSVSLGNHSVGEYVRVGDRLRRVTSVISSGDTIDNSNSVVVKVMDELADAKDAAKDASNITSGTLPIARGGTGQSETTSTATVSNIASAGTNCSITGASYLQWGKVAQIYLGIKANAAISSGAVIATVVSGKRPALTTPLLNIAGSQFCNLYDNGQLKTTSAMSSGTVFYLVGTYLLP